MKLWKRRKAATDTSENERPATAAAGSTDAEQLPAGGSAEELRKLALSPGLQSLWGALLPALGVPPSRPGEYPGIFKVESGPGDREATIYIDLPAKPYEHGKPSQMERVVTLNVKLDHDYRLLGDRYYCLDCEVPADESSH